MVNKHSRKKTLLSAYSLSLSLGQNKKIINDVSFDIFQGETLTFIGEAGSGKTTLAKAILGHLPLDDGSVFWNGALAFGNNPDLSFENTLLKQRIDFLKKLNQTHAKEIIKYNKEYNKWYLIFVSENDENIENKKPKNAEHIIDESKAATKFKIFSEKHKDQIKKFYKYISTSLEIAYELINTVEKEMKFLKRVKSEIFIDENLFNHFINSLTLLEQKIKAFLLCQLEQKKSIKEIRHFKNDVYDGNYNSDAVLFNNILKKLEYTIELHSKAKANLEDAQKNYNFIKFILSTGYLRKRNKKLINKRIRNSIDEEKIFNLAILKELILKDHISKTINLNPKYQKASKNEIAVLLEKIVFLSQDPNDNISGKMTVEQILDEVINSQIKNTNNFDMKQEYQDWMISHVYDRAIVKKKVDLNKQAIKDKFKTSILNCVGLTNDALLTRLDDLTLAEKQRIQLAIKLINKFEIIVYDETLSAVDVQLKAQILRMLRRMQEVFDLTYIFIESDLEVAKIMSDRVAVVYGGRLVELGTTEDIFEHAFHPFTKFLINSSFSSNSKKNKNKSKVENYDYKLEHYDYDYDLPKWIEVTRGHFVLANEREAITFRKSKSKVNKNS